MQTVLQEIIEQAEKSPGTVPEQLLWDLKAGPGAALLLTSSCLLRGLLVQVALPRGETGASSGPCDQSTPAAAPPAATQRVQALLAAAGSASASSAPAVR